MNNLVEKLKSEVNALTEGVIKDERAAIRAAEAASILADLYRLESRAKHLLNDEPRVESPRRLTLEDAAEFVLREAKRPLHAKELGRRIKLAGWTHPRSANPHPNQIYFQLAARLPKHKQRFRKVAPATWSLISDQD